MSKLQNENLFLLEFLVEDVNLTAASKCTCQQSAGEYCVSFSFLDNVDLEVCERDFNPEKRFGSGNDNSRIGKSCLFSLTPQQAQTALKNFDIHVEVIKRVSRDERTIIGECQVPAVNLLNDLLQSGEDNPPASVLQESYTLTNPEGSNAGTINVYVRMSCYGKMIITQFQMNLKDKTVLFKDKEGRSLYRYKKSKKRSKEIEDLTQDQNCIPSCPNVNQQNYQMQSPSSYPPANPNCPMQPCFPQNVPSAAGYHQMPPSSPNMFSPGSQYPANRNCPTQPCFPQNSPSAAGYQRPPGSQYQAMQGFSSHGSPNNRRQSCCDTNGQFGPANASPSQNFPPCYGGAQGQGMGERSRYLPT